VSTIDIVDVAEGNRTAIGAVPRQRRSWAWLGLVPFVAFLVLFLILPAVGVINRGLHTASGAWSLQPLGEAVTKERKSFLNSLRLSFITAALGAVFGTSLAYAAATAKRPKWLRSLVTSFSGVAANMGGVVLAFVFVSLLGAQGLGTRLLKEAGWDLYGNGFKLNEFKGFSPGISTVYLYFQIPLMVLVTLPAVDGLKQSWREASSNLGGNTFTYWRRVGLPVLAPSMLGGFLLLFANAFSAFATAYALNNQANLTPVKISFYLQGDNSSGKSPMPYALSTWMILTMLVSMAGYLLLRRRAERWRT
jgi:putative spermidine/putrescine transport system permease protein